MEEFTTMRVKKTTKTKLEMKGKYGESHETILLKILTEGEKDGDQRNEQIL